MFHLLKHKHSWFALVLLIAVGAAAVSWWWLNWANGLPNFVVMSNGRLELTRNDVAVKFPGRIAELHFEEGQTVQKGAILAKQESADILQQIAGAKAERARVLSMMARAKAESQARQNAERLARLEWNEAKTMHEKKLVSDSELERRQIALDAETAAVEATKSALSEAQAGLEIADAGMARLEIALKDMEIRAPVTGRVEHRLIEEDAVLPSGGRIATILRSRGCLHGGLPAGGGRRKTEGGR